MVKDKRKCETTDIHTHLQEHYTSTYFYSTGARRRGLILMYAIAMTMVNGHIHNSSCSSYLSDPPVHFDLVLRAMQVSPSSNLLPTSQRAPAFQHPTTALPHLLDFPPPPCPSRLLLALSITFPPSPFTPSLIRPHPDLTRIQSSAR
jgi:hypothetical protein